MAKANDKCNIIKRLPKACCDELAAVEFMEAQRWGDDPCCTFCGSLNVYKMTKRGTSAERVKHYRWRCRDCNRQFSVRMGTVFEDSLIPLRHWCYAFWQACASKKGVSAMQIHRQTQISYKSALFMLHRVRYAMSETNLPKLAPGGGTVEIDETFVGGKPRHPYHRNQRRKHDEWRRWRKHKTAVLAAVERGGEVRASAVPNIKANTLWKYISRNVDQSASLMTDEAPAYKTIGKPFTKHQSVMHHVGEYVRDDVYTNTVEGFFAIMKRGLNGIYHAVSKKHLNNYVSEFQFRYNQRKVSDGERITNAIRRSQGKRVQYKKHIGR